MKNVRIIFSEVHVIGSHRGWCDVVVPDVNDLKACPPGSPYSLHTAGRPRDHAGVTMLNKEGRLDRWAEYFEQQSSWPPDATYLVALNVEPGVVNLEPSMVSEFYDCLCFLKCHRASIPHDLLPEIIKKKGEVVIYRLISGVCEYTESSPKTSYTNGCPSRVLTPCIIINEILRRTLEVLRNSSDQINYDENLVDLEYTDDIVLIFKEEETIRVVTEHPTYYPGKAIGNCISSDCSLTDCREAEAVRWPALDLADEYADYENSVLPVLLAFQDGDSVIPNAPGWRYYKVFYNLNNKFIADENNQNDILSCVWRSRRSELFGCQFTDRKHQASSTVMDLPRATNAETSFTETNLVLLTFLTVSDTTRRVTCDLAEGVDKRQGF
ncbi:hypothetical protein CLF_113213 [Clonorchis sinensis]|uniref:Reverse transcriptase domain-containing protein n=1 Tax=Clonorchis sinensis TaxID=79923 RepID=G7YXX0_CLOSI|nr:hypothetical protein CLF_113213 [Clonorchis sinensis]